MPGQSRCIWPWVPWQQLNCVLVWLWIADDKLRINLDLVIHLYIFFFFALEVTEDAKEWKF